MQSHYPRFCGAITAAVRDYYTSRQMVLDGWVCYNLDSTRLQRYDGTLAVWVDLPIGTIVSFPCQVRMLIDDTDQAGAPPAAPYLGAAYIVNNWGVGNYALPAGPVLYEDGDLAEWTTAGWVRVLANNAGAPPSNYRCVIGTAGNAGSFVGHENHIGYYNPAIGAWAFDLPLDGWVVNIIGEYGDYENTEWIYDQLAPAWLSTGGGGGSSHRIVVIKDVDLNAVAITPIFAHPTADCVVIRVHAINWDIASGVALNYQIDSSAAQMIVNASGGAPLNTGITLETVNQGILIPALEIVQMNITVASGVPGDLADIEAEIVIND